MIDTAANERTKSAERKRRGEGHRTPDCDSESFDGTPSVPRPKQPSRLKKTGASAKRASPPGATPSRAASRPRANGSTPSAAARPRAAPACAICWAARARALPRWRTSACRCRPASPSPPRSARTITPTTRTIRRSWRAGRRRPRPHRAHHRQAFRRPRQSAAGLGALRRARVDARHDGHRAQPRPQRRDRRGAGASSPATGASPTIRYRRFITMYSNVVLGIEHHNFEDILEDHKDAHGYTLDTELSADDWVDAGRALSRSASRRSRARRSRRTRTSNCGARSARCSARG